MTTRLTWSDLLIEDATITDHRLFEDWAWLVHAPFRPIAATKFGDLFIERPDGRVEMLDAQEGTLRELAASIADFRQLINTEPKQTEWLLSLLVLTLHEKGVVAGAGEGYAFKTPLVLGGKAVSENVMVSDLVVLVSLAGQLHRQLQTMPPGAPITAFIMKQPEASPAQTRRRCQNCNYQEERAGEDGKICPACGTYFR
jgi:hypothetical protein